MNLKLYKHIYLLGIGGIGMSALARYFHAEGKLVAGYDRVASPIALNLVEEGFDIHYTDDPSQIPAGLLALNKQKVLVV